MVLPVAVLYLYEDYLLRISASESFLELKANFYFIYSELPLRVWGRCLLYLVDVKSRDDGCASRGEVC